MNDLRNLLHALARALLYGPSPVNQVFDVLNSGRHHRKHGDDDDDD